MPPAADPSLIDHMNMILRLLEAGAIPTLAEEIEVESLGPESQFIVLRWRRRSNHHRQPSTIIWHG
jgi:hypothetical protein